MKSIISSDDPVLQEDIEYVASHIDLSFLYGSAILITGATGLIGSHLVKTLVFLNRTKNARIHIFAFVRKNSPKIDSVFSDLREHINFVEGDIVTMPEISGAIDYIIHGASITSSKTFIEKPVETIHTAIIGTRNMLDLAREKKTKSLVYLSSMEVFGLTSPGLTEISESDYGYIDILNPRSSYPESKRMCECLCACYAKEYNVPVKIARLAQTFGAGMDYNENRVPVQFARSVLENKDIILNTEGKTLRPCLYIRDAVIGIYILLHKGTNSEAYTLANRTTTITIRETAEMVADKIAKNKIKVLFKIDKTTEYAPDFTLNLNTSKAEALGWRAEVGIEEAYRRMIESLRYRNKT